MEPHNTSLCYGIPRLDPHTTFRTDIGRICEPCRPPQQSIRPLMVDHRDSSYDNHELTMLKNETQRKPKAK
jgi:hypothetical protein